MRRAYVAMGLTNAFALVLAASGYVVFARTLGASDFGLYAVGSGLARAAALVLDGGMKVALIKQQPRAGPGVILALRRLSHLAAVGGVLLAASAALLAARYRLASASDAVFVFVYVGVYLATYTGIMLRTAVLERELKYLKIAGPEAASHAIELGLPILLIGHFGTGLWAFPICAGIARGCRTLWLEAVRFEHPDAVRVQVRDAFPIVREGLWFQLGVLSNAVRDNLPALLIAPLFGKGWAGYYAWAIQLAVLSTQIFVMTGARLMTAYHAHGVSAVERAGAALEQTRWLAMLTVPPMAVVLVFAPWLNEAVFGGKWDAALSLVPWLLMRAVPGIATSALGTSLLVSQGAARYAAWSVQWSCWEAGLAVAMVWACGPIGLAVSYAMAPWIALWLLAQRDDGRSAPRAAAALLHALLLRPATMVTVIALGAWYAVRRHESKFQLAGLPPWALVTMTAVALLAAYGSETRIRALVRAALHRPERRIPAASE